MNKYNRQILRQFLLIALPFLLLPAYLAAQIDQTQPHVLLLNSYHKGYLWTDEITRGVEETLAGSGTVLHVEYMDTKRHFSTDYLSLLSQLLSLKHGKYNYKVILVSDDNAFRFIKEREQEIFGQSPVVFCGLNYLRPQDIRGMSHITGINERADIRANLALIASFHPDRQKIVVITDNTTTGKSIQQEVQRIKDEAQPGHQKIELIYDLTTDELQQKLNKLDNRSVVLFTFFFRDRKGTFLEYDESIGLVIKAAGSVPIYISWKFSLQPGVVGGHLTSGYDQGAKAAEKAYEIVTGKPVDQLPIIWQSPTRLWLDYKELQRLAIDPSLIPPEAKLLHPPVSFFQQHKTLFIRIATVIGVLILAITGLIYGLIRSRRAEKTLRSAESFISNIIESMPSVLVGIDSNGKITHWNNKASETTGISDKLAIGQPLTTTFPRISPELEHVKKAMHSRKVIHRPRQAHTPAGNEICFEDITIYPLTSNGTQGAVIRLDDVTEKIRLEEMMIQSEKMVSVGGLAAGMAHEINNPLAGMIQTANVMKDRLTNSKLPANIRVAEAIGIPLAAIEQYMTERGIPKMLSRIRESGNRAADIVTNMLQFARKSSNIISSHNLTEILDQCLDLAGSDYDLKKNFDFRQINIVREYQENLPLLPCDKNRLQQVFLNILRNGAEAMQEHHKQTTAPHTFTLRVFAHENDYIHIEIEDNGPGMDERVRKRVFEPFFTTKQVNRGTGLGLSVSYFIITEIHKGRMEVESTPGEGSTFIIELLLERKSDDASAQRR